MSGAVHDDLVEGWAQFHDGTGWHAARFSVVRSTGQLVVRSDDREPTALSLRRVSGMDEILGSPAGRQHVEISVEGAVAMDAVWPDGFASELTDALLATVETPVESPVESSAFHDELSEQVTTATVEAVDEPAAGTEDAVPVDPGVDATGSRPLRTRAGVIGALALIGCGAVIVGVLGLRNHADTPPRAPVTTTAVERVEATSTTVEDSGPS